MAALKVRRARRADFDRVRALLGTHDPAARADRKRFRRLVSTLREDLYVAERTGDEELVGLAVIGYLRGLGPPTAIVRRLLGVADGAADALLDCARVRAAARGCAVVELALEVDRAAADPFAATLLRAGWTEGPRMLVRSVTA